MVNAFISARRRPGDRASGCGRCLRPSVAARGRTGRGPPLLWPLVCALPERQRAVIVLRYYEDLSEGEAADCSAAPWAP